MKGKIISFGKIPDGYKQLYDRMDIETIYSLNDFKLKFKNDLMLHDYIVIFGKETDRKNIDQFFQIIEEYKTKPIEIYHIIGEQPSDIDKKYNIKNLENPLDILNKNIKSIPERKISKKKILIVDDQKEILEIMNEYLSDEYEVDFTDSGKISMEMIKNKDYDLAIIDKQLDCSDEKINGDELIRHMKNFYKEKGLNLSTILMTGYLESYDVSIYVKNKIDDIFYKPFLQDDIKHAIKSILLEKSEYVLKKKRNYSIIINDDNEFVLDVLYESFIDSGFKQQNIIRVDRPENAIKLLKEKNIDLLITDYIFRNDPQQLHVKKLLNAARFDKPVILMSGSYEPENIKEYYDHFWFKNDKIEKLINNSIILLEDDYYNIKRIRPRKQNEKGRIIAVIGLPGVGKSTICEYLKNSIKTLDIAIRYTTRNKRSYEIPEQEFVFVDYNKIKKMRINGILKKELYKHKGHLYSSDISEPIGHDVLVPTGLEGFRKIKKFYPDVIPVYLISSYETIKKRMREQKRPEDEIALREKNLSKNSYSLYHEIKKEHNIKNSDDFIFINENSSEPEKFKNMQKTAVKIARIIRNERENES